MSKKKVVKKTNEEKGESKKSTVTNQAIKKQLAVLEKKIDALTEMIETLSKQRQAQDFRDKKFGRPFHKHRNGNAGFNRNRGGGFRRDAKPHHNHDSFGNSEEGNSSRGRFGKVFSKKRNKF